MKRTAICLLSLLALAPWAICASDPPASAPATGPASTQYSLPQERDMFDLYPCGDKLYIHSFPKHAEPPPGTRLHLIPSVLCLDTQTGDVFDMLGTLPVQTDPASTMCYGLVLAPNRKSAVMSVESESYAAIGGLYMVDLVKRKAVKMLPPGRYNPMWLGKTLVVPNMGTYRIEQSTKVVPGLNGPMNEVSNTVTGKIGQPYCFDSKGAKMAPLPFYGIPVAASESGDSMVVLGDPKAMNTAIAAAELGEKARVLLVGKRGNLAAELPLSLQGARTCVYSPNFKFAAAQYAYKLNVQGSTDISVFSLDGKKEHRIPELLKCYWVSDTGQFVGITVLDHVLEYWDASGKKVWSVPDVKTAACDGSKVFYAKKDDLKTVYIKPLDEK
jgi:hypothetical protein